MNSNFTTKLPLILLFLGLFAACNPNASQKKQILGKWLDIKNQKNTLDFSEDGTVLRDDQDKLTYSFEREGFMSFQSISRKEEYQIAFKGDTLITLDAESRNKYFRMSALDKPENFKYLVAGQLASVMRKGCENLVVTEIDVNNLPDSVHLQAKFLRAIKPESKVYLGDATFIDKSKTQLSILLKEDKDGYLLPIWRETVEAFAERSTFALLGVKTKKIDLEEVRKGKYKGEIILTDGNKLNIDLDSKKGWLPSDVTSMEVFTTYFVNRELGKKQCEKITLSTEDNYHYTGIAYMNDGNELHIQTDKLKGWSVKNTIEDIKMYITYRIVNGVGSEIQSLEVKKYDSKEYKVKAKLAGGELVTLFVSPEYRGWYPADNPKDLATVVKYQMNTAFLEKGDSIRVNDITLEPFEKKKGQYVGTATINDGSSKKIMVYHKGKAFQWEVVKHFDKPKDKKTNS